MELGISYSIQKSHNELINGKQVMVADEISLESVGISEKTKIQPCEYNYHDDDHEDLCIFECTLDSMLEPDNQLTEKAQQYRDELIIGVERMMGKVNNYRGFY